MKHRRGYWLNLIIYGIATWLFALALTALVTELAGGEFSLTEQGGRIALVISLGLLILSFPTISLILLVAGLLIGGLLMWNDPLVLERFLQSSVFFEIEQSIRALLYSVGVRGWLVPPGEVFVELYAILSALFSVIFLWRLGWYLLGFMALAAALFFHLTLGIDDPWLRWLMLGLTGLLIIASRRRFIRREADEVVQFPALIPIALMLGLTLVLGQILPSSWFYSDSLSEWVNELDEPFRSNAVEERGLFTVGGGYSAISSPINGLINRRNDPYLRVIGPATAIYLRGSVFTEFTGKTWRADTSGGTQEFLTPPDENRLDVFDPFRLQAWERFGTEEAFQGVTQWLNQYSAPQLPLLSDVMMNRERYFQPVDLLIEPVYPNQTVVYTPNVPYELYASASKAVSPGEWPERSSDSVQTYDYHATGRIEINPPGNQTYFISGDAVRTANAQAEIAMRDAGITPRPMDVYGNPVTERTLGRMVFYDSVMQHDPVLAGILYGNAPDLDKILAVRDYLSANYTYDLDVAAVPRDREFIDWFVENQIGYCVHYGTALALLLEDVGIPTRYVEGFVTGTTEPGDDPIGWYERVITTDQAHAWTEVYLDALGWYPFDATPAGERGQGSVLLTTVTNEPEENSGPESPTETETSEALPQAPDRIEEDTEALPGNLPTDEPGVEKQTDLPWSWITLAGAGLYLAWRRLIYRLRHNRRYLLRKYRGREDRLVIRIFNDIQYLHVIGGYTIPRTWSSKQRFDDVLGKTSALDYANADLAEQAIEQVYYAERVPTPEQLAGLISYHAKLEKRVRYKIGWLEWWFRRFLWSPRHPL